MAFGIDSSSPQALTFEDLEQQMLNSVFGGTPLAPFVPMATPLLNQMMGLAGPGWRNPIMDSTVFTNMTPYGTYMHQMQNRFNRVANDALNRQSNAARRGWLENIGRTMMSFESWKQTDLGQQYAATTTDEAVLRQHYDDYIANEAIGRDGWLANAGYKFLDPEGYEAARNYLGMAGANLIRNGALKGRRSAYMQARAVGNMFMGPDGKFNFDKTEYGYMNIGEASAVAAAITKDTDLFSDAGFDTNKIREATEKLRKKVQDYTRALSPLKDIFGTDVPAMIDAIEGISGQKLSQMDAGSMERLSARIAASMQVGGYDIKQLGAMTTQMRGAIGKMAVPFTHELAAGTQAMTVLDATASGMAPAAMTKMRYDNNVGEMVLRTSNSQGAEYLNFAYAAWKDRDENKNKDFNAFKAEYDALRKEYGADAAILRMGGAADFYQLRNQGYASRYYLDAVKEDVGGRIARGERLGTLITYGYMQADGTVRDDYLKATSAIQTDIKLLTDNDYLDEQVKQGIISGDVARQIQTIKQGGYGEELLTAFHFNAELARKEPIYAKQAQLRKTLDAMKEALPENLTEFANNFIKGKGGLLQPLITSKLYTMADEETQGMLRDVAYAADEEMKALGIVDDEERRKFVHDYFAYATENGYKDEAFTEELIKLSAARTTMDEIDKKTAGRNKTQEEQDQWEKARREAVYAGRAMHMSRYVDQERLASYVGTGEGADQRRYDALDRFNYALENGMTEEEAGYEVEDLMTTKSIEGLMDERKFGVRHKAINDRFVKLLEDKAKEDGTLDKKATDAIIKQIGEEFKDNKHIGAITDELKTLVNLGFGREQRADTSIEGAMSLMSQAIDKMGTLSESMEKILTGLGLQPNKDDPK